MPTRDEQMTHRAIQEAGAAMARYLPQLVRSLDALNEQFILLNEYLREKAAARPQARLAAEDDERVPRGDV